MMHSAFEVHMLNEEGKLKARIIAERFNTLLNELTALCGDGRPMAVVTTKLEEACFFAKKGMASQPKNQQEVHP